MIDLKYRGIVTELTLTGEFSQLVEENLADFEKLKINDHVAREIAKVASSSLMSDLKKIILAEYHRDEGKVLVIRGVSVSNKEALLLFYSSFIGVPTTYTGEGGLVMDIKAQKEVDEDVVSYRSANEMRLHTDLSYFSNIPDALGLYCVTPGLLEPIAKCRFASVGSAINELGFYTVEELKKEEFNFPIAEHTRDAKEALGDQAIITRGERTELLRIRFDTVTPSTDEGLDAIGELERSLENAAVEFIPEPETAILFSNRKFVHGRSRFSASYSDDDRHLKRVYINY